MAKEKKQLRELSDEDLKNVTGGYNQYVDYNKYLEEHGGGDDSNNSGASTPPDANIECPDGYDLILGNCMKRTNIIG